MPRISGAALALLAVSFAAQAQPIDLSHGGPVGVTAAGGIDWDQDNQTVTAHEDARATRGNATVTADRLVAHYRKKAGSPAGAVAKPADASTPAANSTALLAGGTPTASAMPGANPAPSSEPAGKPGNPSTPAGKPADQSTPAGKPADRSTPAAQSASAAKPGDPPQGASPAAAGDTGNNEIYRLNAEGRVHIFTPTDQAWGDHAVYDIDQSVLVLTGHGLRLTTPQDLLTARDAMEYWSARHMAVARGDATATSADGRRITGDTLVGYTVQAPASLPGHPAAGQSPTKSPDKAGDPVAGGKLQRVEAYGHVQVRTSTDIVTGDRGVYLPDTGLARVIGHVHITRGENQLNGAAAIINMKTGLATLTQAPGKQVQGLMVPNGGGAAAASNTNAGAAPGSRHKSGAGR